MPNQDAWIVRVIFEDYATGLYPIEIHRHLMDLGAANSTTKRIPGSGNMRKVLSNEVYVGDRMIQKGPVRDLITKQPDFSKPYTSYYLTDDHKPNRGPAVVRAGEGTPWMGGLIRSARPASIGTRNRITCMDWYTAVNAACPTGKVTVPSTRVPNMII